VGWKDRNCHSELEFAYKFVGGTCLYRDYFFKDPGGGKGFDNQSGPGLDSVLSISAFLKRFGPYPPLPLLSGKELDPAVLVGHQIYSCTLKASSRQFRITVSRLKRQKPYSHKDKR
jgi:hypothetical protein